MGLTCGACQSPTPSVLVKFGCKKEEMIHTPDCRGYARAFLVSNSFGKVVNRQARKKNRQCKSVKKFPTMFLQNSFLSNISSSLICNGSNFLFHNALVNGTLTVSKPVKSNLKKTRKKGKQHKKLLHWNGSVGSGNIRDESFCKSTAINSQSSFEDITKDEVSYQATSNSVLEDFFSTEKNDIEENNIHVTMLSDKIDISEKLDVSTDDLSQEEIGCNQAELDEYCTESKYVHADKTSEQAISLSCSRNSVDNQEMSPYSSFCRSITCVRDAAVVGETRECTGSDTGVSSHLSTEKCSLYSYDESVVTFNNPDDLVSQCITTNSNNTYHKKSNNSQAYGNCCFSEDPAFTCHIDDRALCSREACCSSTSIAFPTAKRGRRTRRISGYCNTRQSFGNVKTYSKTRKDINHPVWQRVQRRSSNDESLYKHMHSSSFSLQDDLVGEVTDGRFEQSASFRMRKDGDMELVSNGSASFKMTKHVVDTTKYSAKSSGKLVSKVSEKTKTKSMLIPKQELRKNLYDDKNGLAQVVNKNNDHAVGSICVPRTNSQMSDISPLERASSFPAKPWVKENLHTGRMTPTANTSNMASNISTYSSQKDANLLAKTFDCLDLECTDKENCEAIVAKVCKDLSHSLCHIADKKSKGKKLNDGAFHGEYAKQDYGSFPVLQKWVPVGKKEDLRSRLKGVSSESDGCFSHELDDEKDKSWCNPYIQKGYISCNSQFTQEGGDHCTCIFETDLHKINLVVKDAHRLQVATESFQLANDIPLAAFERFLYSASPMLSQTSNIYTNKYCYQEEWMGDTLCQHQIPNISLQNIWQWYENPGNYGLEVKVEDFLNPKEEGNDNFDFCAYFVPYLSAVQLFGQSATCICSNRSISDDKEKSFEVDKILNDSSQLTNLPISSLLVPHPCSKSVTQVLDSSCRVSPEGISCIKSIHKKCVSAQELLFEYFESEQPQLRHPLLEKIKELIKGNADSNSKTYGDPIMLECLNLHDLHPASWFSVAWYPIYRIPDGNFRAAFLTYHSLGLFTCRRTLMKFDDEVLDIILPVVGLQSYNAKGECWFRQWKPHNEAIQTQGTSLLVPPDDILEERLKTLLTTASVMSRASIYKGDKTSVNKQPDYEFFLSRGS